jgi:hypothetical protein
MEENELREIQSSLADRYAMIFEMVNGHLPLIMHRVCYDYMGCGGVQIVEANIYDTVSNADVVIENRSGNRAHIEFRELSWGFGRKTISRLSEVTKEEYIRGG